eukprot:3337445-Pleurochrysis_carterae.AAC.4
MYASFHGLAWVRPGECSHLRYGHIGAVFPICSMFFAFQFLGLLLIASLVVRASKFSLCSKLSRLSQHSRAVHSSWDRDRCLVWPEKDYILQLLAYQTFVVKEPPLVPALSCSSYFHSLAHVGSLPNLANQILDSGAYPQSFAPVSPLRFTITLWRRAQQFSPQRRWTTF